MRLPHAKALLPPAAIAIGAILAFLIMSSSEPPASRPPDAPVPLVRVVTVEPQSVQLRVRTHGTVVPRTESELIPQVSGPVVWVSPAMVSGGFFEEGEALLGIDPRDYEAALESARAALARRRSEHDRAKKQFDRQSKLRGRDAASESVFDDADNDLRVAVASLREARAALDKAERDLDRCQVVAPFTGRVRSEQVDVGQFVNRGQSVARLYAIDYAEVRLPVPDDDLAFIDLPLAHRGQRSEEQQPEVELSARFAGAMRQWRGRVVRTEGEIDPRSRMIHVVARVEDPYAQVAGQPPLAVGLFVDAEILGRRVDGVVVVPRSAVHAGGLVHVVDREDRLRFRPIEILRQEHDRVLVRAGLRGGERVATSRLAIPVEGMRVRPVALGAALDGTPQPAPEPTP
ncbi:MAG: efflux RND transporter periplasmic adaptor subunit [Deltaproteobacteria bacterium]|nr:efflux RND transporter periplasmic adaptor subunit [Deltaproteobacteria bacterium]MBW2419997.1 efflux RND transporter periplasmic adaptor subunit [Deltaproteobacteria bacterium]